MRDSLKFKTSGFFKRKRTDEKGSVLITVVWILIILAVFSVTVSRLASGELMLGRWVKDQAQTRFMARSGIERALLEIQVDPFITFEALNESWASNPNVFEKMTFGSGSVTVLCDPFYKPQTSEKKPESLLNKPDPKIPPKLFGACDEASRLNLNKADEQALKQLFIAAVPDMDETHAVQIAQSILDWRDTDDAAMQNGAEASFYHFGTRSYEPRNGPLESVEELTMIRGVTPEVFESVRPYVTVYSAGPVNVNTAGFVVLSALGLTPDLAQRVIAYRNGGDGVPGTEDDQLFQMPEAITASLSSTGTFSSEEFKLVTDAMARKLVDVKSKVFRIHSIGRLIRGNKMEETVLTCVIHRDGAVFYWHEGSTAV